MRVWGPATIGLWLASGLGCLALAGLDGAYSVGEGGAATGTASPTGSGSTSSSSTGGTGGASTGGAGLQGAAGAQTGSGAGASGAGGSGGQGQGGSASGGWAPIDTFDVPCTGGVVNSQATLDDGVTYHLRATGTCEVLDTTLGDAEYWDFASTPQDDAGSVDLGIAIDGSDTEPYWGSYDSSHVYEVSWMGVGTTISAQFLDPNYGDNSGSLTLEILAWQ